MYTEGSTATRPADQRVRRPAAGIVTGPVAGAASMVGIDTGFRLDGFVHGRRVAWHDDGPAGRADLLPRATGGGG